jgi:flagellin-like hook-associated protein FlgL
MLKNERGLSDAQLRQLQENSLTALDEVNNLLVQAEVSVGSKTGFLDNLKDSLDKLKYDAEDQATVIQQADVAQIAVDLSRREILYQMSLSIAGKLMSVSLLDFLS